MVIISNFTREYLAKSSLRRRINSSAVQVADNWVNPQISAKRILKICKDIYDGFTERVIIPKKLT